ncbi:hypothetical protein OIE68_14955 [Nocardia vinacea]|uniref:Twin-arginine translocation signal domain-containing protein n=1 Tax=Nocardia vinacea TaxID=96468 RepID=A0ABZ1YYV9_9NOCA|nr:hypothetical protein OIE68_14955 [Nocardia vinacea]
MAENVVVPDSEPFARRTLLKAGAAATVAAIAIATPARPRRGSDIPPRRGLG